MLYNKNVPYCYCYKHFESHKSCKKYLKFHFLRHRKQTHCILSAKKAPFFKGNPAVFSENIKIVHCSVHMCTCQSLYFKGLNPFPFTLPQTSRISSDTTVWNMFQYCPEGRLFFPLEWHNFSLFHHVQMDCGAFLSSPLAPPPPPSKPLCSKVNWMQPTTNKSPLSTDRR